MNPSYEKLRINKHQLKVGCDLDKRVMSEEWMLRNILTNNLLLMKLKVKKLCIFFWCNFLA